MDFTGENLFLIPKLHRMGVRMTTSHLVKEIGERHVTGFWALTPEAPVEWLADSAVLVTSRKPEEALFLELQSDPDRLERHGIEAVYRVGDCVAPRLEVADAIFDGHRLAREIDTEDPAVPRPYLRERALVAAA
jgi:dimethylamine/trimethylamine dehydrogenase